MNLEHQPNEFRIDVAKDDFRQEDAFQRAIIALHQAKLNDEHIKAKPPVATGSYHPCRNLRPFGPKSRLAVGDLKSA